MREIIMTDESFEDIYDVCMDYILECEDAHERYNYWRELRNCRGEYGTLYADRNWAKLVDTGIFHDAIGEIYKETGNKLFVDEEY